MPDSVSVLGNPVLMEVAFCAVQQDNGWGTQFPAQRKIQLNWCAPFTLVFSRTEPGLPHPQSLQCLDWEAAPTSAHHIPGNTLGLGGAGAVSEKYPAKNASLGQGRPRKTLGPGREIRRALKPGHWRGRRRKKAEPSQAPGEI